MNKDIIIYLESMLEKIQKIEKNLKGVRYETFAEDDDIFDLVVRRMELLGEAVNKLPSSFRLKFPDVPWRDIIDTRNKLIHDYMRISPRIVWKICKEDLPLLKKQLQDILKLQ